MLGGEHVVTAVHEGIEADLQFIQLASESTSASLDRYRTGHYRRRAGVGSIGRAVSTQFSSRSCAAWGWDAVDVSQRTQGHSRTVYGPSGSRSGPDHGVGLPDSDPVAVSIPSLGVRSTLVDLGRDSNGAMEVPQDPARAGWFSRGPAPGALGPAVIAGHVTWDGAPAVFHRLSTMRHGDQVTVIRKDGKTAVFTVSRVARFSKSRFPTRAVYGPIDHAGLRLITCGGTYDAARRTYLDNVVVFARLEAVRGPHG
jgi:Sortase domain